MSGFDQPSPRLHGVFLAQVEEGQEQTRPGRVKIRLPWVDQTEGRAAVAWARVATTMAGNGRGTFFLPEPGDEVLVSFLAGDPNHPVVVGALWNGVDVPPEAMSADNHLRTIASRAGHLLRFDDTPGAERVELWSAVQGGGSEGDPNADGQRHQVILDVAGGTITVEHANGAKIEIDSGGKVTILALDKLEVTATQVEVNAPMSKFSGVVQAETVITNSVISSSYTPGAGNVW